MNRQFFESLLVFQLVTSRLSPVNRYFSLKVVAKKERRYKKALVYISVMLIAFIFQVKIYTMCKYFLPPIYQQSWLARQQNYYEVMNLQPNSTPEQIQLAHS